MFELRIEILISFSMCQSLRINDVNTIILEQNSVSVMCTYYVLKLGV